MTNVDDINWRIQRISPSDAAKMLKIVSMNGHIDKPSLQSFEKDMREGRWVLNGSPIILGADASVLDGRARLHACVRSENVFETLVVSGITKDAFETIDSIRKRTLADVLSIRKELHGRSLGAALRILWSYESRVTPGKAKTPGITALLAILEQRPEIRESVLPALRAIPILPHGCGIALHHLAARINLEKADRFFAELGEPVSSEPNHPVNQLRNALLGLRGQGGVRKQTYILAIAIKAWNAFFHGRRIKQLRFGAERETFPRLDADSGWGPLGDSVHSSNLSSVKERQFSLNVRSVTVTPEMAETLLASRGPNRHVSAPVINKYARDMLAGRWLLNGQTIKISEEGRLLDGQHRLEAAKKAQVSFPSLIVEGLSEDTFASLDIGRKRAVSDILRERGESNTTSLASALRWLWMIDNGVVLSANSAPTNGELLELLEQNPEIRGSLKHVASMRDMMGGGIAAALHQTFSRKDVVKANEFSLV